MNLIITPIFSSLIGYLTNKLAIKMLFRPRKKVLGIQGLLIKRKVDLARSLSRTIVDRFLDKDNSASPSEGEIIKHVQGMLRIVVEDFLVSNGLSVSEEFKSGLCDIIIAEAISKLDLPNAPKACQDEVIDKICKNILNIPDQEIEGLVNSIAEKEFFAIEIIGAVLGFFIGLGNALLVYYAG